MLHIDFNEVIAYFYTYFADKDSNQKDLESSFLDNQKNFSNLNYDELKDEIKKKFEKEIEAGTNTALKFILGFSPSTHHWCKKPIKSELFINTEISINDGRSTKKTKEIPEFKKILFVKEIKTKNGYKYHLGDGKHRFNILKNEGVNEFECYIVKENDNPQEKIIDFLSSIESKKFGEILGTEIRKKVIENIFIHAASPIEPIPIDNINIKE